MKTYGRVFRPSGLVLVAAMLVPHLAGAQVAKSAAAQASSATAVAQVGVDRVGQQTIVRVQGDGPLNYHVTRMSDPPRVVVDFDQARLVAPSNTIASSYDPVRRVRLGQSRPDQVRVVIDLASPVQFKVERKDQALFVAFGDQSQSTVAHSPAPAVKPAIKQDAQTAKAPAEQAAGQQSFRLPATLGGNAALASPLPQTLSAAAVPNRAIPSAAQVTVKPAVADASQPVVAQPVAAAVKGYTGEAISVNLKDVDLKDFFRLIHEISGLNVVLDPAIHGNLTIVLDDVPWDQALDIVLKNNDLSRQLDGNVLRIATVDTLRHEAEGRRAQIDAEALAVDKDSITRYLSCAHAKDVLLPVKKFLSQRGDVVAVERTNSLIVSDIPAVLPQIDRIIQQLDRQK